MSKDEQEPPIDTDGPTTRKRKPWFGPNRSGPGWHPRSWQGWLVLGIIVAAIVTIVVLFRTGVL